MTLTAKVEFALIDAGMTLDELSSNADQVIVFGSCALGCDTPASDVDLLCVGEGARMDTGRLHLLWIEASRLHDPGWLGSEIGGHIAKYGVWLSGRRSLGPPQRPSVRTLQKKRQRILDRANVLIHKWLLLSPGFKAKQLRNLRLDLQRYQLLCAGEPVVPNPILDRRWKEQSNNMEWLNDLLGTDGELYEALIELTSKSRKAVFR